MAAHSLPDDVALAATVIGALFRESDAGRRLQAWGGVDAAHVGPAAKAAGCTRDQAVAWLSGSLELPPRQTLGLVRGFLTVVAKARDWGIPWDDPRELPDGVPLTARFGFDCPVMDASDWDSFAKHVASSAVRWGADARRSGGHGSAVVTATLAALAAAVARAAPGERIDVRIPELSGQDQELVRQVLVRSRDRAASEDAAGDRPGHNDAARRGLDVLHERWAANMGWRDPRTGWRPRKQRAGMED